MKSTVKISNEQSRSGIMIHEDGDTVILVTKWPSMGNEFEGVVLADKEGRSGGNYEVGHFGSCWDKAQFVGFHGTVTLEN